MKKSNSLLETLLRRRLAIRVSPLEKYANKTWLARQPFKQSRDTILAKCAGESGQGNKA
jgi:hypothetical protein